jgi:hypothetical protein
MCSAAAQERRPGAAARALAEMQMPAEQSAALAAAAVPEARGTLPEESKLIGLVVQGPLVAQGRYFEDREVPSRK